MARMTAFTSCPGCGAKVASADRFCGVCGTDLTTPANSGPRAHDRAPAQPAGPAKPGANLHKTMLGVAPVQPGGAPPAGAGPVQAPKAVPQRTMLGMSVPLVGGQASAPQPAASPPAGEAHAPFGAFSSEPPPRPAAPAEQAPLHKRTLLGVTPAMSAQLAAANPARALAVEAPAKSPDQARLEAPVEPAAAPRGAPTSADRVAAKLPAQSARTVLGITPPVAARVDPAPAEPADTRPEHARPRSFTPVSTPAADAHTQGRASMPSGAPEDYAASLAPPAPPGALRFLWLAVGALTVLAVGGGVLAWLSARGPALNVRVVHVAGAEMLEVEAPGSSPESKLRFLGVEQPLSAGRARFPLKADALKIGDNELAIDLISKDGSVESSSVRLAVAYRVRVDTAPLSATPPAVDVVVDALPGSRVTLDAVPLALDEKGYASRRYPVLPQAGGVFAFSATYRVEPPGEKPADGKLELSLPVTSMQIDTPGAEVVTDQPLLEVAGQVEPGAAVEVAGREAQVIDGRFLHRAQLGELGDHTLKVVARAKGKAPKIAEIKVERVKDLTLAAASFVPDPSLTYARIAQKPVIYRGQKVAFDGRVYHAEVDGGRSVLQMLVLDCPGQSRCPLWVEYPQATQVDLDSWVRVLGVVAGEQQFRSKQGQVHTVPSVSAQYVLKLAK